MSTQRHNQLQRVYLYLKKHEATASMVSKATGIYQKNVTRYKRTLEKAGNLKEVRKGYCKVTHHLAWYLTADPDKFPHTPQLNLFEK